HDALPISIILGVPSDTGANLFRWASLGPLGIREAYLERYKKLSKNVIDVGDVVTVPQLLHDEMLSNSQIDVVRDVLYGTQGEDLPVSPLSIVRAALDA